MTTTPKKNLTGPVHVWKVSDPKRTFGVVTLPFHEARSYIKAVPYDALTGKGQQRHLEESHVRKLRKAIEDGTYTPAPGSANLDRNHRKALVIKQGRFSLDVTADHPLLLTDGRHRFEALSRIVSGLEEELRTETDPAKQAELERVLALPITFIIYFDGNPQRDFANLQRRLAVDPTHALSLRIQAKLLADPAFGLAFNVARLLSERSNSPFDGIIRFDSRKPDKGSLLRPLPLSTLCAKGPSDIGTSLLGLAKVGLMGQTAKEAPWLADAIISAVGVLTADAPELLERDKVLTLPRNQGTKGSATMLIGVGVCLAYRMVILNHDSPTPEDRSPLVESARETLDLSPDRNFSGPSKRLLLGEFARKFLADLDGEKHDGLPLSLLTTLSASAFGASRLPRKAPANMKA
jgi:hypothetical protein